MDDSYRSEERRYREREAASYESHFSAYQNNCERRALLSFLSDDAGVLVDVGCGTQRFHAEMIARARSVIGVDFSFDSLAIAREKEGGRNYFVQGDVIDLPLRDDLADTVVSIQVLEHLLDPEDARRMMEAIRQVMKERSRAFITVYNLHIYDRALRRRSGRSASHRFERYTPPDLRRLIIEVFGTKAKVDIQAQCLFLRRGQRWLQRFGALDPILARMPGAVHFSSFISATVVRD
jgi:SAM-dependent methyltransferase